MKEGTVVPEGSVCEGGETASSRNTMAPLAFLLLDLFSWESGY